MGVGFRFENDSKELKRCHVGITLSLILTNEHPRACDHLLPSSFTIDMSKLEILAELPKLSPLDRTEIWEQIWRLEENSSSTKPKPPTTRTRLSVPHGLK